MRKPTGSTCHRKQLILVIRNQGESASRRRLLASQCSPHCHTTIIVAAQWWQNHPLLPPSHGIHACSRKHSPLEIWANSARERRTGVPTPRVAGCAQGNSTRDPHKRSKHSVRRRSARTRGGVRTHRTAVAVPPVAAVGSVACSHESGLSFWRERTRRSVHSPTPRWRKATAMGIGARPGRGAAGRTPTMV